MKKLSFLSRITLLLGFFFTLDKLLGFLRVIIIARAFNLSFQLDAFNAADILPTLLTALISGEALAMAFIPILTQTLTLRGRTAAWDLFSRVVNLAFIITGAMSLIAAIFADPIVRLWITPGFTASQQHIVSSLLRLDLIAACIFSISGIVVGGLQANEHFLLPALAPIFYNIGQIFGAAILAPATPLHLGPLTFPTFGLGVYGLTYEIILGAVLHLLIQIPGLIRYGFRWTPSIKINDPAMVAALKVIGPRVVTVLFVQLMFVARSSFGLAARTNRRAHFFNLWLDDYGSSRNVIRNCDCHCHASNSF